MGEGDGEEKAVSDDEASDGDSDSGYDEGDHDELAQELHNEAQAFLQDLAMFRKKVGSDNDRFGLRETLAELIGGH